MVLDAAATTGLIAKLGIVSQPGAQTVINSTSVYDLLGAASLNFTLNVTKSTLSPDPDEPNCSANFGESGTSCPNSAYPTCTGFQAGVTWGSCRGTVTEYGSFGLGIGTRSSAQVQLVRQGHTVSHILATELAWSVPVEACQDEQDPSNQNCNQNFGGSSHPCGSAYPECRGFVQGSSWGKCWKPCIPGGVWAGHLID